MKIPKIAFHKSSSDLDKANATSLKKSEKKNSGRRRQDAVIANITNPVLNLDRRAANSDRRINNDPNYNGPSRRYTIDRRLNMKDRREKS